MPDFHDLALGTAGPTSSELSWAFLPSRPSSSFPVSPPPPPCSPAPPFLLLCSFCLFAQLMRPAEQTLPSHRIWNQTGCLKHISIPLPHAFRHKSPVIPPSSLRSNSCYWQEQNGQTMAFALGGGMSGQGQRGRRGQRALGLQHQAPQSWVLTLFAAEALPWPRLGADAWPEAASKWVQPPPLGLGKIQPPGPCRIACPRARHHTWAWVVIFIVAVFPRPGLGKVTARGCRCKREFLWLRLDAVHSRWDLAACPAHPHLPRSTLRGFPLSGGSAGGAAS